MARGKASVDASELEKLEWPYDWPPPWRSQRLLGHEAAERTPARRASQRAAASRLAADRPARHRQGDAGLALRPLPARRPGAGLVRRRNRKPRRADRRPGPVADRGPLASRPVPSPAHAQSRHRPHARRDRRRRRARARRLHAHDAGDGAVARRHRRFGRRDEPQQRQCGAEDPRGAAAQRGAADRGARAGPPAADHPLALPPACPAAARRRDRDAAAGRPRAPGEGRRRGWCWRG